MNLSFSPAVSAILGHAAKDVRTFDRLDVDTKFLVALNATGRPLYAGTVPAAEVQRRRTANRVARKSRRINRLRAA